MNRKPSFDSTLSPPQIKVTRVKVPQEVMQALHESILKAVDESHKNAARAFWPMVLRRV